MRKLLSAAMKVVMVALFTVGVIALVLASVFVIEMLATQHHFHDVPR